MARTRVAHICSECGTTHPKWTGQCGGCGAWNTLVDEAVEPADEPSASPAPGWRSEPPTLIHEIDVEAGRPRPTGIAELDRVLGGGLVDGSVTLLGGEPGIGKSTLLLQLLAWWPGRTLYVSAEESAQQVRQRAERLGAVRPDLWISGHTSITDVVASIDEVAPALVVIDSIQTVSDPAVGSPPGSVAQVRACAHRLVGEAKARHLPTVLVGHVTKEGGLAGPRVLEHVVDTVLSFDGHRHHGLRLLRATKHRFGATGELGVFEMTAAGLVGVRDASGLFIADRRHGVAGSAVAPTIDGHRPLLVEVQALTTASPPQVPARRTAQGVDGSRLAVLLAVLERRARVPTASHDVYVATAGGARVVEPGADLATIAAIVSSLTDRAVPADVVLLGEVGLGGELRQVGHAERRLAEAGRLGFTRAVVPTGSPEAHGIETVPVGTLIEALGRVGLAGPPLSRGRSPITT